MMTTSRKNTALHIACCRWASLNVIKMLIDLGGRKLVMAKNKEDDTALHDFCCQIKRHTKAANKIKLMLQVADTERLLKEKNDDGERPLDLARYCEGSIE